jgi:hypothetical protein
MGDNSRDTQFKNFSNALTDELIKYLTSRGGLTLDEIEQEWNKIIAHRAYDLVQHTLNKTNEHSYQFMMSSCEYHPTIEKCMKRIPDMTELPKEQSNE